MNSRILIIPSWYPSEANPSQGSFIKEQSILLSSEFDSKVIFGTAVYIGRKKFYKLIYKGINRLINFRIVQENKSLQTYYFEYLLPTFINQNLQHQIIFRAYNNCLKYIFDKEKWIPQLIHAHSSLYAGVIANYISKLHNVPYVITEHQHLIFNYFTNSQFKLCKYAMEQASRVLSVSNFQSRMILMNGVRCEPIVVGNYVNDILFSQNTASDIKSTLKILTVGYHTHLKDFDTLFKALKHLLNLKVFDFTVTIISPKFGETIYDFEEMSEKMGIKEKCIFLAEIDREEIQSLFKECDVFVSTSIAETFGLAIAEALCVGKPVVVTDSGGVNDFVIHGENGYVVKQKDYEAVAESLVKIYNKKLHFKADKIRHGIVEKYGHVAFKEKIKEVYLKSLDERI